MIYIQALWLLTIVFNTLMLIKSMRLEHHKDAKMYGLFQIFLMLLSKVLF
jgi:hypothetical protein